MSAALARGEYDDARDDCRAMGNDQLLAEITALEYEVVDPLDGDEFARYVAAERLRAARDVLAWRARLHGQGAAVADPTADEHRAWADLAREVRERIDLAEFFHNEGIRLRKTGKREHHGPCPWCGGDPVTGDRFMVWDAEPRKPARYYCRRCGSRGDAISAYRALYAGVGFREAVRTMAGAIGLAVPERPPANLRSNTMEVDADTAARIGTLERENQRLAAELEQCKAIQRGLFGLQANTYTTKQSPVVAGVLRHVISRRAAVDDWVPIPIGAWRRVDHATGELVETPSEIAGGRGRETTSNVVKSFADTRPELLEYRPVRGRDGKSLLECRSAAPSLAVALLAAASTDRPLARVAESNPPAKYHPDKTCQDCGGSTFRERRRLVEQVELECADCGARAQQPQVVVRDWAPAPVSKNSTLEVRREGSPLRPVVGSPSVEFFDTGERTHWPSESEWNDIILRKVERMAAMRAVAPAPAHIRLLDEPPKPGGPCAVDGCPRPAEYDNADDGYCCAAHALFKRGGRTRPLATHPVEHLAVGHD